MDFGARIIIDHTKIGKDLTDFPLLVVLTSSNTVSGTFPDLLSNKQKVAFRDSAMVECYAEIEGYKTGEIRYWVKVPSVSSTVDTELFFFCALDDDNTTYVGETGSGAAQNVWTDNYISVYHMAQDPSGSGACILDSTATEKHGTPYGSMVAGDLVDTDYGKALHFDGVNDYIAAPFDRTLVSTPCFIIQFETEDHTTDSFFSISNSPTSGAPWIWDARTSATDGKYLITNKAWLYRTGLQDYTSFVEALSFDGAVWTHWQNGVSAATLNYTLLGTAPATFLYLGSGYGGKLQGKINQFFVLAEAPDEDWMATFNHVLKNNITSYDDVKPPNYTISGTISDGTNLLTRTVYLYSQDTGMLIDKTMSNDEGVFKFSYLEVKPYFIVAFDDDTGESFNAQIFDKVMPVNVL